MKLTTCSISTVVQNASQFHSWIKVDHTGCTTELHTCKCESFCLKYHLQRWEVNDQHLTNYRECYCQQEHTVT